MEEIPIDENIRAILQKLQVAGEAESILLTAELRVLLRLHVERLRLKALELASHPPTANAA